MSPQTDHQGQSAILVRELEKARTAAARDSDIIELQSRGQGTVSGTSGDGSYRRPEARTMQYSQTSNSGLPGQDFQKDIRGKGEGVGEGLRECCGGTSTVLSSSHDGGAGGAA